MPMFTSKAMEKKKSQLATLTGKKKLCKVKPMMYSVVTGITTKIK
jgi:hypothetical protein